MALKKKGRRKGPGSRKGKSRARNPRKKEWAKRIKTLRSVIRELRDAERIRKSDYRKLYLKAKGGMFKNRKHILLYIREHELLQEGKPIVKKKAKPAAKQPKKAAQKAQPASPAKQAKAKKAVKK